MINMENREIEKIALETYPEHKDLPENDITRYFPQYRYGFIQGYTKALEQNKQLLDEIDLVNNINGKLNDNNIKLLDEIEQLKFELKAADSVNENLSKQVEWISVKDRLPTERVEFVLLFNADAPKYNQCVYQGVWFLQEKKFKSDTVHNLLGTITHWMPLPNQPK